MLSGMTFVFASLLELAVVGFLSRNESGMNASGGLSVRQRRPRRDDRKQSSWSVRSSDLYAGELDALG